MATMAAMASSSPPVTGVRFAVVKLTPVVCPTVPEPPYAGMVWAAFGAAVCDAAVGAAVEAPGSEFPGVGGAAVEAPLWGAAVLPGAAVRFPGPALGAAVGTRAGLLEDPPGIPPMAPPVAPDARFWAPWARRAACWAARTGAVAMRQST